MTYVKKDHAGCCVENRLEGKGRSGEPYYENIVVIQTKSNGRLSPVCKYQS